MASIQTDRRRVRRLRLEPDMAKAHLRMIKIVVNENTLARKYPDFQSLGLAIGTNGGRHTHLNRAEHANRTLFADAVFVGNSTGQSIFVHSASAQIPHRNAERFCLRAATGPKSLRGLLRPRASP